MTRTGVKIKQAIGVIFIPAKMHNYEPEFTDNIPVPVIRSYAVSTARDHDTTVDLSKTGITVYRDKGYFGHDPKGIDGTMDRSVRNHKLSMESIRMNLRISRKRSLVEYPYAIMKRMFHFSHVMVDLLPLSLGHL